MKILWIVNMLMPEIAEHLGVQTGSSGTWMIDISKKLSMENDVELSIACVHGNEFKKVKLNNITYYMLPGNGKNMLFYTKAYEKIWAKINDEFKPDIVHLHGTEYSHGLSFLRVCPNVKAVVSIQGILTRIKDVDFGGISKFEYLKNTTFKQIVRFNSDFAMHHLHKKNSLYEKEILERVQYINGVNTWDISLAKSINSDLKAFKIEYNLRDEMYNSSKWDISKISRHTIFTNPGGTPLKGLHMLLKAVNLLKKKYPDILVKVPGMGINGKLNVTGAYSKIIKKYIEKNNLEKHVEFLGRQTGQEMCDNMLNAHVTVVPSAIEGTSMVLREAMFLGCPSIASFRGGMADFISDKIDGFLYDYQEYPYLATRIDELFENDDLCVKFSQNAILKTEIAHNRTKNIDEYIKMYNTILND